MCGWEGDGVGVELDVWGVGACINVCVCVCVCVCVHTYLCLTTDQIHLMSHIHSFPIKPVASFEDMTLTRTNVDISMETMSIWAF